MRKRLFVFLLAGFLLALSACGNTDTEETNEAECNVGYDGMPVMVNERYEQIPDKEDITPEDLFGESMEEAY